MQKDYSLGLNSECSEELSSKDGISTDLLNSIGLIANHGNSLQNTLTNLNHFEQTHPKASFLFFDCG